MTTLQQPAENLAWYALSPQATAGQMGVDPDAGLDAHEAARRLEEYGPNELPAEPPPGVWVVARGQLVNPMNIMLLIVVAASFAIVQIATAVVVLGLVTFNVVMGTAQELKARASVEALAKLQVPHARVRRSGQIESTRLVPGDIVLLEAGDVVPADGRGPAAYRHRGSPGSRLGRRLHPHRRVGLHGRGQGRLDRTGQGARPLPGQHRRC
jgi:P-type Ca2+ transporter type 2C